MKSVVALCALLIQLIPTWQCSSASSQQRKQVKLQTEANSAQNDREWRAGTYLGLTAGKSTRVDVLRVLGEPKRLDTPADQTPQ